MDYGLIKSANVYGTESNLKTKWYLTLTLFIDTIKEFAGFWTFGDRQIEIHLIQNPYVIMDGVFKMKIFQLTGTVTVIWILSGRE